MNENNGSTSRILEMVIMEVYMYTVQQLENYSQFVDMCGIYNFMLLPVHNVLILKHSKTGKLRLEYKGVLWWKIHRWWGFGFFYWYLYFFQHDIYFFIFLNYLFDKKKITHAFTRLSILMHIYCRGNSHILKSHNHE